MSLIEYIKDNLISIFANLINLIVIVTLLVLFNTNNFLVVMIIVLYILTILIPFIYNFIKRKIFYDDFNKRIEEIDQRLLVIEIIKDPEFLEGRKLKDYLYQINKSYLEEINKYKNSMDDFKEYIELWCHEIKTPIAIAKLMIENNPDKVTSDVEEELTNIDNYIEQVLFYARSDNPENDYIIGKVNLTKLTENIIKKNKKMLINKKIKIKNFKEDIYIESDIKWLEFIINQIIINSIKYSKELDAYIEFDYIKNMNSLDLIIRDNGIGIPSNELERVFNKGFTGSNGRKKYNSTGIGLYLCKKLSLKLGHKIKIESEENQYTKVTITFPINSMMNNLTEM